MIRSRLLARVGARASCTTAIFKVGDAASPGRSAAPAAKLPLQNTIARRQRRQTRSQAKGNLRDATMGFDVIQSIIAVRGKVCAFGDAISRMTGAVDRIYGV